MGKPQPKTNVLQMKSRKRKPMLEKGFITPSQYAENAYMSLIIPAEASETHRLMLGIPQTGTIRSEWAQSRYGQIIPCNWSMSDCVQWLNQATPLNYNVADARNIIIHIGMTRDFEWILFNDSDTMMPVDCFMKMNEYMRDGSIPIVAGLYTTKSDPPEPLIYRGAGTSYFRNFILGEKVWADGCGFGCTLVNVKIFRAMAVDAPPYTPAGWPYPPIPRIIDTPQFYWTDPEVGSISTWGGTEDLAFFKRVHEGGYFAKAGWPKIQKRKWPLMVDTSIFCYHIREDGVKFPLRFEW
jgi:hypothetical protein